VRAGLDTDFPIRLAPWERSAGPYVLPYCRTKVWACIFHFSLKGISRLQPRMQAAGPTTPYHNLQMSNNVSAG